MLVRDALDRVVPNRSDRADVLAGRLFSVVIAAGVYVLSLTWTRSVFEIAAVAFSGYVTLTPLLLLGVRWRRFTPAGAMASLAAGTTVLFLTLAGVLSDLGFLPVFWGFVAAVAAGIGVSLAAPSDRGARAFGSQR
jgi:SSS family solute:Na+ symporter